MWQAPEDAGPQAWQPSARGWLHGGGAAPEASGRKAAAASEAWGVPVGLRDGHHWPDADSWQRPQVLQAILQYCLLSCHGTAGHCHFFEEEGVNLGAARLQRLADAAYSFVVAGAVGQLACTAPWPYSMLWFYSAVVPECKMARHQRRVVICAALWHPLNTTGCICHGGARTRRPTGLL